MKTSTLLCGLLLAASVVGLGFFEQAVADAPQTDFMAKPAPLPVPAKTEVITVAAPLYEIAEPNILELFLAAVGQMKTSGEYQKRFDAQKEKIRDRMQNPPANDSLKTAETIRREALQPAVPESLPAQLLAEAQNIELPKLSRVLLFIDAREEKHLDMLPTMAKSPAGRPNRLDRRKHSESKPPDGQTVFFDQGGALARRFGFTAQPAAVFNGENGPEFVEFPVEDFSAVLPLLTRSSEL